MQRKSGRRRQTAPEPGPRRRHAWMSAAVIVMAIAVVYARGFSAPFIFDDYGTIIENPQLASWFGPSPDTALAGRPLSHLTFALNQAFGGHDVGGYHAVNVLVHVLCALAVAAVIRRTLELRPELTPAPLSASEFATAAALVWAVHPLTSEPVSYLTQRTESLMALCFLVAVYGSIRSLRPPHPRRWQAAAVGACIAGAGAKETIAVAPIVIALYDGVFGDPGFRAAFRQRWRYYAALSITWVVLAALLVSGGQSFNAGFETANVSTLQYFLNQPRMLARYALLVVWPQPLVLYYGWPPPIALTAALPYLLPVTAVFAVAMVATIRRSAAGFLLFAAFVTLGPASSVVTIATEVGAERRMYLPMAALAPLLVYGLTWAASRLAPAHRRRAAAGGAIATAIVLLGARTFARTLDYASPLRMAETVAAGWPSANAEYMLGTELIAAGRRDEGIAHLQAAAPDYPAARYPLGVALMEAGRTDEALGQLRRFVQDEPSSLASRSAHGLIANALTEAGRPADAIPHYREYLAANDTDADAWNALGVAQIRSGRSRDAVDAFAAAARHRPGDPRLWMNLGSLLRDRGDLAAARTAFERALQADASFTPAADALRALPRR